MKNDIVLLKNLGATCYLNTSLQLFLTCKKFISAIIKNKHIIKNNDINSKESGDNYLLYLLIYVLYNTKNDKKYDQYSVIKMIMKKLELKNIQSDSNEVVLKIFDYIEKNKISDIYNLFYLSYSVDSANCNVCNASIYEKQLLNISNWIQYDELLNLESKMTRCDNLKCSNKNPQKLNVKINHLPDYIFVYLLNSEIKHSFYIAGIKYKIKIMSMFSGSDNNGHYYNVIFGKRNVYKIDDDNISILNNINSRDSLVHVVYKKSN
jgi:ubiquitin C-terminal hydrolase